MYTKKKCKIYVLSVLLCTFFFSCSSIDFELPQGPQGTNGKSAYEIWKEEVETGHINWPSTQVDLADFLVYIKGEKGDKGKDGMSAYDQWKILITQGNVTNPHDPSLIWPSSKNTEADFWDFLSGRDGESPHIGLLQKIQKPIFGIFLAEETENHLILAKMGIGISAIKIQKSKLSAKMERMELMAKTDFPPMNYGNNLLLAAI